VFQQKLLRIVAMTLCALVFSFVFMPYSTDAADTNTVQATTKAYVVKPGDTLWKIAVSQQVGLSELIAANPQLKNTNLIVPNQIIQVPLRDAALDLEQQVVQLINIERKKAGLQPLTSNWELARVARYKSADMRDRNYFAHQSPTYGSPFDMIQAFGLSYRYAGENIAAGQSTSKEVVTAWMNSSGHRSNILNPNFTKIGVGLAKGGAYSYYWTQMFMG